MIIGICGLQSSGKDTIAHYLIREHDFIKMSFASVLKDIISIMFGWPRDKLEGLTKEDREWREQIDYWWSETLQMPQLTPRYVMQYFATDLFRNKFHPDIWVKIVENKLNKLLEQGTKQNIVLSDCRFENEINMLMRLGGKIIQVYREPPDWFHKYRNGENPNEIKYIHHSEIEWIRCYRDYDINNNGTIEELYEKIKHILDKTT
jgi:dephospho-CoA kinase